MKQWTRKEVNYRSAISCYDCVNCQWDHKSYFCNVINDFVDPSYICDSFAETFDQFEERRQQHAARKSNEYGGKNE